MQFLNTFKSCGDALLTPFMKALIFQIDELGPVNVSLEDGSSALVMHKEGHDEVYSPYAKWNAEGQCIKGDAAAIKEFTLFAEAHPPIGSRWRHKKGTEYTVVLVTNTHSDRMNEFPITVCYRDTSGRIWSRPLYAWYGSMTRLTNP